MSGLLVSLYDGREASSSALVAVDPDSGRVRRVPVTAPAGGRRFMGLCMDAGVVYLAASSDMTASLLLLDAATLAQTGCIDLPGVRDGHSLMCRQGDLQIVSSGTDELIRFRLVDGTAAGRTVVWAAGDKRQDVNHLNSVALYRGHILVSAFGKAREGGRAAAGDGYIQDVRTGQRIISGLPHPHSVGVHGDHIYYCESRTGRFRHGSRTVMTLDGYLRGAAWLSRHHVCLGVSEGRPPSGAPHASAADCALWICDVATGAVVKRISLAAFGPEIYDVLLLPNGWS